ncbi:MAG: adenylate kinase [Candidatus Binatia bacterium]
MRVVFLGPPGAGKGTQTRFLEGKCGACPVSTGDILRKAVREQTPLGKKAAEYLDKGELVPDDVMVNLVAERLREEDCKRGFILDGFPRTIAQADGLEAVLRDMASGLECVFCIQVPKGVIIQRLAGRRTCRRCGTLYHVDFNPPSREGVCDRCHGDLYQREDDQEETIGARLRVYEVQTAPLIDYYRKKGLLREINGVGTVEEIRTHVLQALGEVET